MKKYKVALQVHSVREDFAERPFETLKKIKEMGYDGIEFNYGPRGDYTAKELREALDKEGLVCYSAMGGWDAFSRENIEATADYLIQLGVQHIVIGQVNFAEIDENPACVKDIVEHMIWVNDYMKSRGLKSGYHAHDGDYTHTVDGVPFYEYVMANTPSDFGMTVDTGNIMGGNGDPIACLKKFPGRSPVLHIKGYGQEKGYTTPVWESELDWVDLFTTARDIADTEIFFIEFGKRGDYDPCDRAAKSCTWLREWVNKL